MLRSSAGIHRELWLRPDCTMVREIRDGILRESDDLAAASDNEGLLASEPVLEHLRQGAVGVERMAAVLWALGLEDPARRELFRLLPAFVPESPRELAVSQTNTSKRQEVSEKERHKRRRKAAEGRVTELEREVGALCRRGRERADELTRLTGERQRLDAELERLTAAVRELETERDGHRDSARSLTAQLKSTERDAARAQQANLRLRAELDEQRGRRPASTRAWAPHPRAGDREDKDRGARGGASRGSPRQGRRRELPGRAGAAN